MSARLKEWRGDVMSGWPGKMEPLNFEFKALQEQGRRGAWRNVLETVKKAKLLQVHKPHETIAYSTYYVLALTKLGSYGAAVEELDLIGDLNRTDLQYEEHPDIYGGELIGSMVPFSLRWLQAELPNRLGQTSLSIQRMYSLLSHCQEKISRLSESGTFSATAAAAYQEVGDDLKKLSLDGSNPEELLFKSQPNSVLLERWRRRLDVVIYSIVNLHLGQKEFVIALTFVNRMLAQNPDDPLLWSRFGYIQLQLGDMEGCKKTFRKVEELGGQGGDQGGSQGGDQGGGRGGSQGLVGRNKGMMLFVDKDYEGAVKELNGVLEEDEEDVVAANNKALCLMYSRDLIRAIQVLEDVLQKHTAAALNETLVLNLCSMYELAAVNSNESKRTLSSWMLQVAPHDFDLTCTRL